uniref:Uncharacterized protein n=1 Tax=Arundo donax TaxID=35708 RepID=A0A0A9GV92_ARUDO
MLLLLASFPSAPYIEHKQ